MQFRIEFLVIIRLVILLRSQDDFCFREASSFFLHRTWRGREQLSGNGELQVADCTFFV